jgi:hypothetical protein
MEFGRCLARAAREACGVNVLERRACFVGRSRELDLATALHPPLLETPRNRRRVMVGIGVWAQVSDQNQVGAVGIAQTGRDPGSSRA